MEEYESSLIVGALKDINNTLIRTNELLARMEKKSFTTKSVEPSKSPAEDDDYWNVEGGTALGRAITY